MKVGSIRESMIQRIWDLVERGRECAGEMERRGEFDGLPRRG